MTNRLLRNRYLLAADLFCWPLIPAVLLALRLESVGAVEPYLPALAWFVAIAVPIKLTVLYSRGLYQRYWRFASVDELIDIVLAVLVASIIAWLAYFLVVWPLTGHTPRLPRSTPIGDMFVTLIQVGGVRFLARARERIKHRRTHAPDRDAVVIIGAGDVGSMIVRELQRDPQSRLEPVAFLDDELAKRGSVIYGVRVVGGREDLVRVAESYNARHVIIAMPSAPGRIVREIRDVCERAHLTVQTVPRMGDVISGKVTVGALRKVEIEDLLRREPVVTDQAAVAELVRGTTVLVTGAGGSIGSELCRQIAGLGVRRMVLVGHGENSIFEIHNELQMRFPGVEYHPLIADIRNAGRIGSIFDLYRPQSVFHAAAHKHVPLMELNPEEAVTNNVGGTLALLRHAERTGVSRFIFVSTDKAVHPANVMGRTKLLAEFLVHEFGQRTGEAYLSVRFGNVLGSRGSVVPFFQRQIARGGPVTVTHEDVRRYFMTIPEAVQLVLQAAALGCCGETFVLDMGQPIRIVDLAKDLIRLSGLEVGHDVDIVFTGLRPGEKMFEELFLEGEEYDRTAHEKIFVARNGRPGPSTRDGGLAELLDAARAGDVVRTHSLLRALVPPPSPKQRFQSASAQAFRMPASSVSPVAQGGGEPALRDAHP